MRTRSTIIFVCMMLFNLSSKTLLAQKLIAHYPFDNNVKDISGNNNNGVIIGDVKPTIDRFGNYCGALSFSGLDCYIEVPDSKSLSSINNKISVSCWFKLEKNQLHPLDKWLTLICKGDGITETDNNPQYRVQIFQSDKQSTVSVNTEFTEYDNDFNNHIIEHGKWYFYTLVYDGNFVKTYFNGNKIWEFAYNGSFNKNNVPLNIGRDVPGSLEFFCGSLDDLKIYNGVLSESDIIKLYNDNSGSVFEEPFTLKCPNDISSNAINDNCFALVNYKEPEFKINCGDASLKLIKGLPSGSNFPVGTTTITYKVESNVGRKKTCSFNVSVKDNTPPVIKCPGDVNLSIDANSDFINYDYKTPYTSDACGTDNIILISGINSGGNFPVGITENKFKVVDKNGNSSECSFNVTVSKKTPIVNPVTTNNTPVSNNPTVPVMPVVNIDSIKEAQALQDKIRQEELDKIKASKDQLIVDKDKLADEKTKMNDSLMQMQEERDKVAAEKLKIEQENEKLELLKKQQEKQVLDLKRSIDSLAKIKQQITNGAQATQKYDLFNVPLEVGATAKINNVYFVADASFLQIPSYAELDKLVLFLQKNNNLKVEIGGHTNGLCDDTFCMKLSTSRAKTCVDYLITKGINADRLNYKGYGKSQLLKPQAPGDALNQRVEIKIIGI